MATGFLHHQRRNRSNSAIVTMTMTMTTALTREPTDALSKCLQLSKRRPMNWTSWKPWKGWPSKRSRHHPDAARNHLSTRLERENATDHDHVQFRWKLSEPDETSSVLSRLSLPITISVAEHSVVGTSMQIRPRSVRRPYVNSICTEHYPKIRT